MRSNRIKKSKAYDGESPETLMRKMREWGKRSEKRNDPVGGECDRLDKPQRKFIPYRTLDGKVLDLLDGSKEAEQYERRVQGQGIRYIAHAGESDIQAYMRVMKEWGERSEKRNDPVGPSKPRY